MENQNIVSVFDAVSVAASGTENSEPINTKHVRRLRVWIESIESDTTVALQGSVDGAVTWVELVGSLTDAGPQAVYELPPPLVRLTAVNADVSNAEVITAGLVLEPLV